MSTKPSNPKNKKADKSNKRDFRAFSKSGPSQISDILMKKLKQEVNNVQTKKALILDTINDQANSKRFEISTNGKSNNHTICSRNYFRKGY